MSGGHRLAIVAHFANGHALARHVQIHLHLLRPLVDKLVLISNSPLDRGALRSAQSVCDSVHQRDNTGWDFAAWRDALANESPEQFDWTILTNSSVVGPVFPLRPLLEDMEATDADFWGMTRSHELAPHLPSWFVSYSQKVVGSPTWTGFWGGVENLSDKRRVIREYELGLTTVLEDAGFQSGSVTENMRWRLEPTPRPPFLVWRNNDALLDPIGLLNRGVPYIKASLIWGRDQKRKFRLSDVQSAYPDFDWEQLSI